MGLSQIHLCGAAVVGVVGVWTFQKLGWGVRHPQNFGLACDL